MKMKVLIADDDPLYLRLIEKLLTPEYEVAIAVDGRQALDALQASDGPAIAVLDWQMPRMAGLEVCHRVQQLARAVPVYLLLVTSRNNPADIRAGFAAGADDYLTKPLDPGELAARVAVGRRVVELQQKLAAEVVRLEQALSQVEHLEGLLPICAWCKRIRDDKNYWQQLDSYLSQHSHLKFTHGICPQCLATVRKEAEGQPCVPSHQVS
jgi:PleD family two-component response regulator